MLTSGYFVDSGSREVQAFVAAALADRDSGSGTARAVALFEAVRDRIRYDPYSLSFSPLGYRASAVAEREAAFCVPKAILLAACLRAAGIPALVGFADVRNHLNSARLTALMGTDLFVWHGYVRLWVDGRAFKVTPAFDSGLCERFGVKPLVFDGTSDALFHPYDAHERRHMEYVRDHGVFEEPPIERIFQAFRDTYPALARHGSASGVSDPAFGQARSVAGAAGLSPKNTMKPDAAIRTERETS